MISLEKWSILTPLQKLPKNVGDLGKFIVAKGFKKLPKVQKIGQSGHTGSEWETKCNRNIGTKFYNYDRLKCKQCSKHSKFEIN